MSEVEGRVLMKADNLKFMVHCRICAQQQTLQLRRPKSPFKPARQAALESQQVRLHASQYSKARLGTVSGHIGHGPTVCCSLWHNISLPALCLPPMVAMNFTV